MIEERKIRTIKGNRNKLIKMVWGIIQNIKMLKGMDRKLSIKLSMIQRKWKMTYKIPSKKYSLNLTNCKTKK